MNIKRLFEEFLTGMKTKYSDEYIEIFVNPSKKEIEISAGNSAEGSGFRFVATRKRKLYVFSPRVIHISALNAMEKKVPGVSGYLSKDNLAGVASRSGSKYQIIAIHNQNLSEIYQVIKWAKKNWLKWSWLEKYNIVIPEKEMEEL